ncbi:meiosis-specific with OB domain-containing protein isoform X2 [Chelonus insularis]|uniref:meiosis-specific with OB domain-containing protein isoform X2 n=1 Tax=Chelonus insularis TaxID=460826 RepID=UPI00158AB38D|nr:meiosis-specific with OB domain-containing protein isoform X2 [Chelonus insularis]
MTTVHRQTLSSLHPDAQNTLIVGLIINSFNPRSFDTHSKFGSFTRCVWTFTLRDIETNTINVTVWGSEDYVKNLVASYHIGTVVDVISAKVNLRKADDKNEMFVPSVSSLFSLTVNEGIALIQRHEGADVDEYKTLLHLPIKNISNVSSVQNVVENLQTMLNQFVNLVVIVTFIGEAKNIITKQGRSMVTRDFEATDGSYPDTVAFKLWENDWVERSGLWEPKSTVLFLADVQVIFNRYKKKNTLAIVRKTMITENPSIPQTIEIRKSVKLDKDYQPHDPFIVPMPESIKNVMTIMEISQRLHQKKPDNVDRIQFSTILYAQVTDMELDNPNIPIIITRCALCKRIVTNRKESCMNLDCPCGNGRRAPENIDHFYIKVNLKDDTGHFLIGCRLTGPPAEQALGCTPTEFRIILFLLGNDE